MLSAPDGRDAPATFRHSMFKEYNTAYAEVQAKKTIFMSRGVCFLFYHVILRVNMKEFSHIFLDWREPLLDEAARRLRTLARGSFPADFSRLRIVLPTAEAGRLLRERVAELCADCGGAADLDITLPELLALPGESAAPAEVLAAWLNTLRRADGRDYPELFRNGVLARFGGSDETLLGWGEALQKCRMELAYEGLDLASAARRLDRLCRSSASEAGQERFERFSEFRALEERYLEQLRRLAPHRPDPAVALVAELERPRLPEGVEKIVLIDCGDLKGAPARWLDNCDAAVEFWIAAPEELSGHFDRFGRPEPEYWNRVPIELDLRRRVRCVPRPDRQARKVLELLNASPNPPDAICVPDPEVAAALETRAEVTAATGGGLRFFVPRELALGTLPWSNLLLKLAALYRDGSVAAAAAVWSDPLFADFARYELGAEELTAALELLDEYRERRLVADMGFLERLLARDPGNAAAALAVLVRELGAWRRKLAAAENPVAAAYEILSRIGEANRLRHLDLRRSESEISALRQLVFDVARLPVDPGAAPELLRRLLGSTRIRLREESPEAVDVVGFLEASWRPGRTLLFAGFNEERISNVSADDPFLPEAARRELGMLTRDRRHAADALRFKALAMNRELFILYGRGTQGGDALLPSRLLMQCPDGELPERVELLFGNALLEEPPPPRPAVPPFLPPWREPPERMRITGFKSYLSCPFAFYLEHVLRLERRDPETPELDSLGCGTLMHDVLRECVKYQHLDPEALAAAAEREFARRMDESFGKNAAGIVRLQGELLAGSLAYFAEEQARQYRDGWRIANAELAVRVPWGKLYRAIFPDAAPEAWREGVILSGQLDRIDLRETPEGCEARVLDYKTNAVAVAPAEAHFVRRPPEDGEEAEFRRAGSADGGERFWRDLQLPLYVLLLRHALAGELKLPPGTRFSAGYFNLPLELTATRVLRFDELDDPAVLDSAARCADAVLERIYRRRIFWPPREPRLVLFDSGELPTALFADPARRHGSGEAAR